MAFWNHNEMGYFKVVVGVNEELIGISHVKAGHFHELEHAVSMLFLNELDVHSVIILYEGGKRINILIRFHSL